jgi:hypothetical protein
VPQGLGWLAAAVVSRRPWALPIAIAVIAYGGRTWARNYDWRNDRTLFSATMTRAAPAHYNFAVALDQTGWIQADQEYRAALITDYSGTVRSACCTSA